MMALSRQLATALTISSMVLIAACTSEGGVFDKKSYDLIDREKGLGRDDYENMAAENIKKVEGQLVTNLDEPLSMIPQVPEIAQILASPRPPKIGRTKLVTVSVTDDVPLKDVLIELARLADVDIELGNGIEGGISFRAKNKPFNEVIERISNLAGLRYKITKGVLRVERDLPYMKNYPVDFLNIQRDMTGGMGITTDVLSTSVGGGGGEGSDSGGGDSGGGGGGVTTGSESEITTESVSDVWQALEANLGEIMNYAPSAAPIVQGAADALLAAPAVAATSGSGEGASAVRGTNGAFYVINRQAGVISVSASERQHEMLKQYLAYLERSVSSQVLIEAKIVEVELDKEFRSGVNWSAMLGNSDFNINFPTTIGNGASYTILGPGIDADGVGAANPTGDNNLGVNLDAVLQFTEQFGTARTLSSPRLHAVNNQSAVMTFAENRVFFTISCPTTPATSSDGVTTGATTSFTSTLSTIPIGIIMNIIPSINLDTQEVTLNVRPTLSRQVGTVVDPASFFCRTEDTPDFLSEVPIVEVRELDSVMKVKSGSVMVIGGLMEESGGNTDEGVPFVSEMPFIGNAFKSAVKTHGKTELIIFIKATIVGSKGSYAPADKTIYEKFTDDPRPLDF